MATDFSEAKLSFPDQQSGMDYLSQLSLTNPVLAEQQIIAFLDALLSSPPPLDTLFFLLEQARVPTCFVEEEMARRYHNKPLILADEEEIYFRKVFAAWRKLGKAYALCVGLGRTLASHPQHADMVASILHRCLYYTGMIILEHYRARRELPAGIWLELHGYYEMAEEWGVAYIPVQDVLENNLQSTHCAAAYITLLLIEITSPYSNSVRDLNLIRRWAGMWAPLVSIHPLESDLEVPAYVVELAKDTALHPCSTIDNLGSDCRRLDTNRLGLQISHALSQLRQRITPSQIGLGEETGGHAISLLEYLLRPWTQAVSPRKFRRYSSEGVARVAVGFEAMYSCVSGKEFEQPDAAKAYSRNEFDQLFTFRDRLDPGQVACIKPKISFPVDEWSVINQSASGFRLARSCAGKKLAHEQLMVVCPHDGDHFLLAHATWLMQEDSGDLIAGVAIMPGMPIGIGVRFAGEANVTSRERFVCAFMLPAVPVVREEASLVLPFGMYQANRVVEVADGETIKRMRLRHIVLSGFDFDRVSFAPL